MCRHFHVLLLQIAADHGPNFLARAHLPVLFPELPHGAYVEVYNATLQIKHGKLLQNESAGIRSLLFKISKTSLPSPPPPPHTHIAKKGDVQVWGLSEGAFTPAASNCWNGCQRSPLFSSGLFRGKLRTYGCLASQYHLTIKWMVQGSVFQRWPSNHVAVAKEQRNTPNITNWPCVYNTWDSPTISETYTKQNQCYPTWQYWGAVQLDVIIRFKIEEKKHKYFKRIPCCGASAGRGAGTALGGRGSCALGVSPPVQPSEPGAPFTYWQPLSKFWLPYPKLPLFIIGYLQIEANWGQNKKHATRPHVASAVFIDNILSEQAKMDFLMQH